MNCLLSTRAFRKTLLVTGHLCECSRPRYPRQPSVWIIVHGDARYILRLPESRGIPRLRDIVEIHPTCNFFSPKDTRDRPTRLWINSIAYNGPGRRVRQPTGNCPKSRRDGFARDCPLRHPVLPMLALRDRSRVAPDFLGGFRRFQRSRARRRGGESRLGRGGGRCPRDRLASQVRWSGVLREPCTTDPCQSSGPQKVGYRDGSLPPPTSCCA